MSQLSKILGKITVTTAGTRVQITSNNISCYAIILQAPKANTGNVFIGDSTVSSINGIALEPGDDYTVTSQSINDYSDSELILSDFYVDSANNGDGVVVHYLTVKPRA